ncbi:MAG: hypothetical protein ABSC05_40085 [Candidatus Solibacter sp.]|jgi:hypothetical protein
MQVAFAIDYIYTVICRPVGQAVNPRGGRIEKYDAADLSGRAGLGVEVDEGKVRNASHG